MESKKTLVVDLTTVSKRNQEKATEKKVEPKVRQKRVITETPGWAKRVAATDDPELQHEIIQHIHAKTITEEREPVQSLILQQITQKIGGYKSQDIEKELFLENEFVDLQYVLHLMVESRNLCYYCKKRTHIIYEYSREPNQWTLERIDNKFGHNKNNVVIACLNCNLHRRTMYHERYVFTKQLNIIKRDN